MNVNEINDIRVFADNMRIRLENNDFKVGWEGCETSYLIKQFRKKVHTVNEICDMSILESLSTYESSKEMIQTLQKFLADVANYAMMISGNIGRSVK